MSRLCFVINDWATLSTAETTQRWMLTAAREHEVYAAPADQLDLQPDGRVIARARLGLHGPEHALDLDTTHAVIVRTNPGRDPRPWANPLLLQALHLLEQRGVQVRNHPRGLLRAASKLYLGALPEQARPRTLVSRSTSAIREFLAALGGPAVAKPVTGTHGTDVYKLSGPDAPNLEQILASLTRNGPAMVQAFVPEAAQGDVRVHLLGGELFEVRGVPAIIARIPPSTDFRSNVHLGGTPAAASLTPAIERLITLVGPQLRADGLWHVGLDVIGGVVVEVNAYSPGGLTDLERMSGLDLLTPLTERLLHEVGAR
jgi:glutathione synthase